jgi:hypothetical protein
VQQKFDIKNTTKFFVLSIPFLFIIRLTNLILSFDSFYSDIKIQSQLQPKHRHFTYNFLSYRLHLIISTLIIYFFQNRNDLNPIASLPLRLFNKFPLISFQNSTKTWINSYQDQRQFDKYKYKKIYTKETDHVLHQDSVIANAMKY